MENIDDIICIEEWNYYLSNGLFQRAFSKLD